MTTMNEARERGFEIGEMVLGAVGDWQTNAPRTLQSTKRILGMSEMGGCREYIRATIAGDPKSPPQPIKWAAFLGTAVGDKIEEILDGGYGFRVQQNVTVTLPRTKITVRGHLDVVGPGFTVDLKTRDGLADVRREGPPFKEQAQISGYLVGDVQAGVHDEDATGHLVYLDRSGKEAATYVWSVTYPQALLILDAVESRLEEVQNALATGFARGHLRDEPESWCYAVGCPFYNACWEGYMPTQQIEHPRQLDAVRRLREGRRMEKEGKEIRETAKEDLRGVEGVTSDTGHTVRWIIVDNPNGGNSDRLDVRPFD